MASKRDKIRLISTAGTGHFYTTDKNKKTTPNKMEISKYDPVVRKHVPYKELPAEKIELPKRKIGRVKASEHPLRYVPERF